MPQADQDFIRAFEAGLQAKARREQMEREKEERDLRMKMLKHQMDREKIEQAIADKTAAQRERMMFAQMQEGQPGTPKVPQSLQDIINQQSMPVGIAPPGMSEAGAPVPSEAPAMGLERPDIQSMQTNVQSPYVPSLPAVEIPGVYGPGATYQPKSSPQMTLQKFLEDKAKQESAMKMFAFQKATEAAYREPRAVPPPVAGRDFPLSPDVEAQKKRLIPVRSTGGSTPEQTQSDVKAIADAIESGLQPPATTGYYSKTMAIKGELARRHFDLTTAQKDWAAIQKHIATLNNAQFERLRQTITFAYDSIDVIEEKFNRLKELGGVSGYRLINRGVLAAVKQVPGELGSTAQALEAQINDLVSELATVYKGGNASTDEGLKLARQNLESNWNEETFRTALKMLRTNLRLRKNSINTSGPMGVSEGSKYLNQGGTTEPDTIEYERVNGVLVPKKKVG